MAGTNHTPGLSPRAAAAAVLVLGFAVSLALNWPGQLSYDSVVQLHDGRFGQYNPWHPPVMAWMLGIADRLLPGTGLFVVFDEFLVTASIVSLLWLAPRISWAAAVAAAIVVALPQFLLYQGIVWKDVLFADCALGGFVVLAHAGARWRNRAARWILICCAFLLLVLATLARQNGAITIPFAALAVFAMARRQRERWSTAIAASLSLALLSAVLAFAASAKLAERTGGVTGVPGQWKLLQLYDLIGEVKNAPRVQLRSLAGVNPDLVRLIRTDGARLYTPARNDTLVGSTDLQNEFASTSASAIAAQWNDNLSGNTATYLAVRARVFYWLFFTPDPVQCDAIYTGLDGPPRYLRELGLARRFRVQDRVLGKYAAVFVHTPVFSHVAWALLAVVLLVVLARRRAVPDIAIAALLGCALAFTLTFFVIGIACDYRYLLFLDLAAIASAFYCAATRPVLPTTEADWRSGTENRD
ncbi:MAG TPA: hypothetical protein VKR31_17455 [Rhizomicrobium sp.]|nr:hypothetical protein [Rhizomicrobium sp.]